jgi:hypothetical protein
MRKEAPTLAVPRPSLRLYSADPWGRKGRVSDAPPPHHCSMLHTVMHNTKMLRSSVVNLTRRRIICWHKQNGPRTNVEAQVVRGPKLVAPSPRAPCNNLVRLCPQDRLLVTRVYLLRGTKKRPPQKDGLVKIWSPVPFYPHPRGGIEMLPSIVPTQGPIRYGKLNFLDCCKFATIGTLFFGLLLSWPPSAHFKYWH